MNHTIAARPLALLLVLAAGCDDGGSGARAPRDGSVSPGVDGSSPGGDGGPAEELDPDVLTGKNDNARSGANLAETELTPANVENLELRATWTVDGELYAQPLVVGGVNTSQGEKTLVLAATMHDSLYAFDLEAGDGAAPLWHAGKDGELGVPGNYTRNVNGPHGILSTPAVDRARGLVYLVARDCDASQTVSVGACANRMDVPVCRMRLFAIELATGAVKAQTVIEGSVPREAGESLAFDPAVQWNRPGLLLEGDALFIAFGSGPNGNQHEEDFIYHGYLFRYDVRDLSAAPEVFATTPNTRGGSVWQAGSGPASDGTHVYFTSANRTLDCTVHPPAEFPSAPDDVEDSVVRLPLAFRTDSAMNEVAHYADTREYTAAGHTGTVFQFTNSGDNGFGSSGPSLIPGASDLVVSSKGGIVYLLDRQTMQPRHTPLSPFTALPLREDHTLYIHSWSGIPVVYGALAIYRPDGADGQPGARALVYGWAQDDLLRVMHYDYAARTLELAATAQVPAMPRGGYLSISAHGGDLDSAIVWATSPTVTGAAGQGHVWAFSAATLATLWQADTPSFSKFTPPTVSRGRLIVPSARAQGDKVLLVYGL
jgi:hypothetical protein